MSTSYDLNCIVCCRCVPSRFIDAKGRIFDTEQTGTIFKSAGGLEVAICVDCVDCDTSAEMPGKAKKA